MTAHEPETPPRSGTSARRRRIASWVMLFILAFIALGYLSNAMTADACKQEAARWLDAGLSGSDWPQRRASSKPAEFRWPWIVSVDYELVLGNLGGEWGTRRYLCLFGIPIPLGNDIYMQS